MNVGVATRGTVSRTPSGVAVARPTSGAKGGLISVTAPEGERRTFGTPSSRVCQGISGRRMAFVSNGAFARARV